MEKIRLANGNTYNIEGGAAENYCSMIFATIEETVPVIKDFTEKNMTKVEFLTEESMVCGEYQNKYLVDSNITALKDGTYRLGLNFGDVDMIVKRLAALEETQEVQDQAIVELASLVG